MGTSRPEENSMFVRSGRLEAPPVAPSGAEMGPSGLEYWSGL